MLFHFPQTITLLTVNKGNIKTFRIYFYSAETHKLTFFGGGGGGEGGGGEVMGLVALVFFCFKICIHILGS